MYAKLENLRKFAGKAEALLTEMRAENERLEKEYQENEAKIVESFLAEMKELASYGKEIFYGMRDKAGNLIVQDEEVTLFFFINDKGDFAFHIGEGDDIYDSVTDSWHYLYGNLLKEYICTHKQELLKTIKTAIERNYEDSITDKLREALIQQNQLLEKVEKTRTTE